MRLNRLTLRGITRFANTVSINFSELPEGLIALVGANGEGKTTIMESIPGALFRQLPSRDGALPNHVQGRDAFIELDYLMGANHYRSLVKADGQTGSQEAHLYNGDGNTALVSGKVKEYDAAIHERIATPSIFLASAFQSQNRKGNFLELGKADRKDLMIQMLGLEQLQVISDRAGERAKVLELEVTNSRAKLSLLDQKLAGIEDLKHNLALDEEALAKAQEDLETWKRRLEELTAREATMRSEAGRRAPMEKDWADTNAAIAELVKTKADLEDKRRNNEGLLAMAETIRKAAAVVEHMAEEIAAKRAELGEAEAAFQELSDRRDEAASYRDKSAQTSQALSTAKNNAEVAKNGELASLDSQIRQAEQELAKLQQTFATLEVRAGAIAQEGQNLRQQAQILEEIPCGDQFPSCSLIANAIAARDGISQVDENANKIVQEAAETAGQRDALQERMAALKEQREAFAAAPIEYPELVAQMEAQFEEERARFGELLVPPQDLETARHRVAVIQGQIRNAEADQAKAKTMADRLPYLEASEARIKELDAETSRVDAEMASKAERLSQLKAEMDALPTQKDLHDIGLNRAVCSGSVKTAEEELSTAQGRVAAGKARLADLEALVPERDELVERLEELHQNLSEWRHLQRAFGRDGIQALEIDAAGPEVSALINELLNSCFGPRFTLSFETTAARADGRGEKEVFDIRIIDNERGREGKLETLSGGEKVILNEAISLALAIYNSRKSGQRFETLFRDETAGALDPDNAQRYLSMLRRAKDLGGFHQLIFIAHQQELWEEADGRVFVRGGGVEVA